MVGLVDVLVLGMMLGVVLVLGMVIVVVLVPVPELVVLVMMRVRMSVLMKGAVVTVIGWVEVLVSSSLSSAMSSGTLSAFFLIKIYFLTWSSPSNTGCLFPSPPSPSLFMASAIKVLYQKLARLIYFFEIVLPS